MNKIAKKMKSISLGAMLGAMLVVISCGSLARAQYEWDEHTVLLDHFDGTTTGETFGSVSYVPSTIIPGPPSPSQAVDLEQGDWIKYTFPKWHEREGTSEMWVYPREYGISLTRWQWNSTSSYPSAGHLGGLDITGDGKLTWWMYDGPPGAPVGNTTIPLNQWTHVLATWHEGGTELYVNGVLDGSSPNNYHPSMNPTVYVYLNLWGGTDLGYVDEFRILDIYIPEPTTIALLGLGGFALRRKRALQSSK